MTLPKDPIDALANAVKPAWQRFLDVYEPLRPELYRYCRYLTKSPWDAEDLVQDTLARAFATLGCLFQPPPNPRAWMFRVASNLWIDRTRRRREVSALPPELAAEPEQRADRAAAGTLIGEVAARVSKMKAAPGRGLVLFAGAGLAGSFIELDLIDEYRLMVHPRLLGRGVGLFTGRTAEARWPCSERRRSRQASFCCVTRDSTEAANPANGVDGIRGTHSGRGRLVAQACRERARGGKVGLHSVRGATQPVDIGTYAPHCRP